MRRQGEQINLIMIANDVDFRFNFDVILLEFLFWALFFNYFCRKFQYFLSSGFSSPLTMKTHREIKFDLDLHS